MLYRTSYNIHPIKQTSSTYSTMKALLSIAQLMVAILPPVAFRSSRTISTTNDDQLMISVIANDTHDTPLVNTSV